MKGLYFALVSRRDASALLIVCAVLAVYANSLDNAFHYDDRHSIVENPHLRELGNIPAFFSQSEYFSRDPDKAMYRPLLLVSFALNYAWGGYDVFGYHLVNVGLHLACALLVWGVLRQLRQPPCMSLLGALFFAVHPLASEPVNYISSRSELLAAAGALGGLWLYLCADGRRGLYAASAGCFAAGLLAKSVALVLPAWILLWELHRGRLAGVASRLWPHVLVAAGYVLVVREFLFKAVVSQPVRTWPEQIGTQVKALVYYAWLLLSPIKLNVDHPFVASGLGEPAVWLCALALGSLFLRLGGQGRLGVAWMLTALLPTLVVPLNVLVNEHRLYLALVGLVVALLGLRDLEAVPGIRWGGPLLIAALALLTWERNRAWADELSLWSDAHRKNPGAVRPLIYMGNAARKTGAAAAAERHFLRALAREPDNPTARANLANVYQDLGQHDRAVAELSRVLDDWPEMTDVYYSLGRALQAAGRDGEALRHYRALPQASPHRALADNNIGTLFERAGRIDSALHYYARAGGLVDATRNLRRLFAGELARVKGALDAGGHGEAEAAARRLLAADGDQRDARFLLAVALYMQQRYGESIAENERLLARHPDFDEGWLQLALVQEVSGRLAAAQGSYKALLRRTRSPEIERIAQQRLRALEERMP